MHRFESQPAYILHARSYQESSLLLELFSRDFGRIAAIAKGAKRRTRGKGGLQGILQPFVPLLISCSGKGELLTLKSFDSEAFYPMLMGRRLVSALYLNELLMRLLYRWDAHVDLFYLYRRTLLELESRCGRGEQNQNNKGEEDREANNNESTQDRSEENRSKEIRFEQITLRLFEKALLKAIGYELQLTKEVDSGESLDPQKYYLFNPEQGPCCILESEFKSLSIQNLNSKRYSPNSKKLMFKGKSLLDLDTECLSDPISLQDSKRLMREALGRHLGSRPLETRKLFL